MVTIICASSMIGSGHRRGIVNVSLQTGKCDFLMLGAHCAAEAGVVILTWARAVGARIQRIYRQGGLPGTVHSN